MSKYKNLLGIENNGFWSRALKVNYGNGAMIEVNDEEGGKFHLRKKVDEVEDGDIN